MGGLQASQIKKGTQKKKKKKKNTVNNTAYTIDKLKVKEIRRKSSSALHLVQLPRERVRETLNFGSYCQYSEFNFQTTPHGPLHTQSLCKCHCLTCCHGLVSSIECGFFLLKAAIMYLHTFFFFGQIGLASL